MANSPSGISIMELAKKHDVEGIDGDCGGVCSCATCHVHLSSEDFKKLGEPSEIEKDMLELDDNYSEHSRLGCQIEVIEAMYRMVLHVAN